MKEFVKKNYVYICLAVCTLVMLYRAFMGFCWTDESFYISTTDRFFKGDIPLVSEWYRTQMSSIIMLPFYHIYMMINGSNEGIALFFRLLYLALSVAVSLMYDKILSREYPKYVALGGALFILCFCHLNMATFSYYMLSNLFLSSALILIYDCRKECKSAELIVAGIMTALAVMSMPAFVIVYVLIMAAVLVLIIAGHNRKQLIRMVLFTTIGIAIPAIAFLIFLFSHVDLNYLIETLPYVLVDNEHSETFGYLIRKPHRCMLSVFGVFTWASYFIIAVSFVFQKILRKHPLRELVILADVLLFTIMTYLSLGHTGYVSVAFFVFIIPIYFLSEKKNRDMFFIIVVPAALVALVYCFASSDFLYIMALGFAMATSAGICMINDHIKGYGDDQADDAGLLKKISSALMVCVCICMLAITFVLRIVNVYRDAPVSKLDHVIPSGIAKGLYTTGEHLEQYMDVYEAIDEYCIGEKKFEIISGNPKGNILMSKIMPMAYAATDMSCGYPTTWRSTAYNDDQLDIYYDLNPGSLPDVIIVFDEEYGSYDASGDVEDDHNPNLDELPDRWRDYISDNGFDEIEVKCGKLYCKLKR